MTRPGFPATFGMILLVGVLWGLNWPTVKTLLNDFSPLTLRAMGFSSAAVGLVVLTKVLGHRLKPARSEVLPLFTTGVFVLFGFNMLAVLGQLFAPASSAAIIAYTMPAITTLLSVLTLGERLHWQQAMAVATSLVGLGVLASADLEGLLFAPLGAGLMLGSALSWAIGNILMKRYVWTLSPLARATWFFLFSALLTWPLVIIFEPLPAFALPGPMALWLFAFHVCGPMIVCYVLWTVILSRLSAAVAAISTLTAPVVGVLSSVLLLGEALPSQKVVALALIVTSIALALLRPSQAPAPSPKSS